MDSFKEFLKTTKALLVNVNDYQGRIHVIIGNESCDLDSMLSALTLGYLWYRKDLPNVLVIPILNISAQELCLRTENCYVLKKLGIDANTLIFKDDLDLNELQKNKSLSVSLVDHHILSTDSQFLSSSVIEIYDHRPIDQNAVWEEDKVKVRIEQVGSCSTLIADEILNYKNHILNDTVIMLLHYTIIFDTIGFNAEAGKFKELDVQISKKLSEKFPLNQDAKSIFNELWTAHNDVSHLTPKQLLSKDLKIVEGLPIPVLPMLVRDYLKLPSSIEALYTFCQENCSSTIVIIGLQVVECDGINRVHRDVAVFNHNGNDINLVDIIITNFKNALQLKGYDFEFEEVLLNINEVRYFKQNNVKPTRKHILPLIKDAVLKYKNDTG